VERDRALPKLDEGPESVIHNAIAAFDRQLSRIPKRDREETKGLVVMWLRDGGKASELARRPPPPPPQWIPSPTSQDEPGLDECRKFQDFRRRRNMIAAYERDASILRLALDALARLEREFLVLSPEELFKAKQLFFSHADPGWSEERLAAVDEAAEKIAEKIDAELDEFEEEWQKDLVLMLVEERPAVRDLIQRKRRGRPVIVPHRKIVDIADEAALRLWWDWDWLKTLNRNPDRIREICQALDAADVRRRKTWPGNWTATATTRPDLIRKALERSYTVANEWARNSWRNA
jgi:hypothetical protein